MDGTVIFTPLYGVHNTGPVSYLLQLRDFTFLLDCGWGDPYEATSLEPLLNVSSSIDAGKRTLYKQHTHLPPLFVTTKFEKLNTRDSMFRVLLALHCFVACTGLGWLPYARDIANERRNLP
jgi:hypothetical protein